MRNESSAESAGTALLDLRSLRRCLIPLAILAPFLFNALFFYSRQTRLSTDIPDTSHLNIAAEVELPGCPDASREYVSQMAKRGFEAELISLPSNVSGETGLRMKYKHGFRATSSTLPSRLDLAARSFDIRHKYHFLKSMTQCPYYTEAARILSVQRASEKSGRPTMAGFGGAHVRCAGKKFVESYPEVDPNLELHMPLKQCTAGKCVSATRRACQRFLAAGENAPLPVYAYSFDEDGERSNLTLKSYAFLGSSATRIVSDPEDACMFVIEIIDVRKAQIIAGLPSRGKGRHFNYAGLEHWNAVDGIPGRNHIVVQPSCSSHCDMSPTLKEHGDLGQARIISQIFWHTMFRPGFDICNPQPPKKSYADLAAAAKLRVYGGNQPIFFFRGGASGHNKWDIDRIIPAAYANDPAHGVLIQVRYRNAVKHPLGHRECDHFTTDSRYNASYLDMMTTATFGYGPGGAGPYSWRLMEVLAAGGIPVVPEDMVVPFQGLTWKSVDRLWEKCAVFLSIDDLYIAGDVLRAVLAEGADAFEARKESCRTLWNDFLLYGNGTVPERHYEVRKRMAFEQIRYDLRTISQTA